MKHSTRLSALALAMMCAAGSWADVPFKPTQFTADGGFAANTIWYNLTIGASGLRIHDNNGAEYISLDRKLTADDENLWCFVGNDAEGYKIINKQAGPGKALTAITALTGSNDGTAYAVLKDTASVATGETFRWDFSEAKKTSSGSDISVENAVFVNEHGMTANKLNNRDSRLAFWVGGYDNGSAIVVSQAESTFGVNLNSGKFTSTNPAGTYASAWASTEVNPQLTLSTGANNMSVNGTDINLASGQTKSSVYTLSAGSGYVVKGFKFSFKNAAANANEVKFTIDGKDYVVTDELQTVEVKGLDKPSAQFTLAGDNHNVLLTDFSVTVSVSYAAQEPQTDLFITDGSKPYPYRIPGIAKAHNGDLVAVSDYRICGADIGFGRVDLVGRISKDNGQTWGDEFIIKSGTGVTGAVDCGFGDPAIVADSESDEMLLISVCGNTVYGSATRQNPNRVARFRSHDNGKTWTDYEEITESIYTLFDDSSMGVIQSLFFGSGRICQSRQVKVGKYYRLYAALCARPNGNRVIYSDDFGETWHALGDINSSPAPAGDEPKCEELPDGTVVLSSRMSGGRYYNFYTYTDVAKGEGSWGTVAASNASNKGVSAVGNSTNGEILILPAVRNADKKEVYVALQSVPFGSGRANVGIYYKELADQSDYRYPDVFAANWDGSHQASYIGSAYSTMIVQANDSIGFMYEEETYGKAYTNVYKQYSLERITNGAYSYKKDVNRGEFVRPQFDTKLKRVEAMTYGDAVGMMDEQKKADMDAAISRAIEAYVANPDPQLYIDANNAIDEAVEDAKIVIDETKCYTLLNKKYPTYYWSVCDIADNTDGTKLSYNGTTSASSLAQKFVFESAGDGTWMIRSVENGSYLSGTKKINKYLIQEADKRMAGLYTVASTQDGWSVITCTSPEVSSMNSVNLSASKHIIGGSSTVDGSRWKMVPAGTTDAIGRVEASSTAAPLKIYDLQGRQLNAAPAKGVYITSDHRKHMAR